MKQQDQTIKWVLIGVGGLLLFNTVSKTINELLATFGLARDVEGKQIDAEIVNPYSPFSYRSFLAAIPTGTQVVYLTNNSAKALAKKLYDAFGVFNDDEEAAIGVFKALKNQVQAAQLSRVFFETYGMDILKFLEGGIYPQDRLSQRDVVQIIDYVNKLPKYR